MAIIEDKPKEEMVNRNVAVSPQDQAAALQQIMANSGQQFYQQVKITPQTPMPEPSCYQTYNNIAHNNHNMGYTHNPNIGTHTGPIYIPQQQPSNAININPHAVSHYYNGVAHSSAWDMNADNFQAGMLQMQQQQQQFYDPNNPRKECLVVSPYNQTPDMQREYDAIQEQNANIYRKIDINRPNVIRPDDDVIRRVNVSPFIRRTVDEVNKREALEQRKVNYTEQFNLRKFNKPVSNNSYKPSVVREEDIIVHIDNAFENLNGKMVTTHTDRIYDPEEYKSGGDVNILHLNSDCGAFNPAIQTFVYQTEGGSDGYYWMDANGIIMPCTKNHCFTNNMKVELAATYGLKEEEIEGIFIVKEYCLASLAKTNITLSDYIKGRVSQYYNCLNELRQKQNTRVITESLMNEFARRIWQTYDASSMVNHSWNTARHVGQLGNYVRLIRFIPYSKITSTRSVYVASAGLIVGDDSILNGTDHPEWKYILPDQEEELDDEVFDFKIKIVDNSTNRQNFITIGGEYFPIRSKRSSYEQEGVYVTVSNRDKTLNKSYSLPLDKAYEIGITHTEEEAKFLRFTSNKTKLLNIEAELQMTKNKLAKVELEKQMLETKREVLATDREVERFRSENKVQNVVMEQATKELDFARNEARENLKFERDVTKTLMDTYLDKLKHAMTVYEVNCKMIEREKAAELALRELDYKSAKLNSETGLSVVTILGKFAKIVGS